VNEKEIVAMDNKIIMIKVEKLHPHPKNPRKNIGDVSELAESIKKSGILQNLTVVPWVSELTGNTEEGEYTVIIGHRRLAASKAAGLAEVPCAIKEMSPAEQLATMLAENVQRTDLTPFEQAEGIQMMFDIGETVADVVKKTGLSESTVRRRSKLLEMDMDKLRATEGRGATLADYERLNQIKDIKKRNELLEDIGTNNFNYNLTQALSEQTRAENKKALFDLLDTFAEKVTTYPAGYTYVKSWSFDNEIKVDIPDDAKDGEYVYYPNAYNVALYKKVKAETKKLSREEQEEQRLRREKDDREMERRNKVKELAKRAYELRKNFVKGFNPTAKDSDNIKRFVWDMAVFGNVYGRSTLGDESLFDNNPDKAMLEVAYCLSGDSEFEYIQTWNGSHTESEETDKLYECLERLGYRMSDEEKKLQDGTHELFVKED
jgi:ParB family chromosome partitioning protein